MPVSRARGKPHSPKTQNRKPPADGSLSQQRNGRYSQSTRYSRKVISKQKSTAVKSTIKKKKETVLTTVTRPIGMDKKGDTEEFKLLKMPKYHPPRDMLWKLLSSGGKNPTIINMKTSTSVAPRAPLTILTGHPRDKQRAVSLQELSRSLPLGTGPLALIHLSSFTQDTQNLPSPLPKLTMMV